MYSEPCPGDNFQPPVSMGGTSRCLNPSITAPTICPPGTTENGGSCTRPDGAVMDKTACPSGYAKKENTCYKASDITCPGGTTARILASKEPQARLKLFCVPNSVVTKPFASSKPGMWPCDENEFGDIVARVCVPPPTSVAPTMASMTSPTLRDLQQDYKTKVAAYEAKVSAALASNDTSALPEIRQRNEEISKLLEEMLTDVVGNPQALHVKREELVTTLNRIESDYAGLTGSADALERLRMIRETQTGVVQTTFNWYLFLFLITCAGILFMALFAPQNMLATSMSPATPASAAPFA